LRLCDWEGNRWFGATLAMHHRLCDIFIYELLAYETEMLHINLQNNAFLTTVDLKFGFLCATRDVPIPKSA